MNKSNAQYERLSKDDLSVIMSFLTDCLKVSDADTYHRLIMEVAAYFGYEYIVYGYMRLPYNFNKKVTIINVSGPSKWVDTYNERGYLLHDPVYAELDRRVKNGIMEKYIPWEFNWELTEKQKEVLSERKAHGLRSGFSALEYSKDKDAGFMISFSGHSVEVQPYMRDVVDIILPHMNAARMKLDVMEMVSSLSEREIAAADLLSKGYSNSSVAGELGITVATVKFHLANIYKKLGVTSRQEAVSVLIAARYMCDCFDRTDR